MNAPYELILKMADDAFIIGHRHSEWTGLGPILEEDIALSSMAQDKIGHALALYGLLHDYFGAADPDTLAFQRAEKDFRCCHLVQRPNGEYDTTLVRHFLFDHAELLRYQLLENSSFQPLAQLSRKIRGELRYHVLHADTLFMRLAKGNEISKARIQSALNELFPVAFGIFEPGPYEDVLIAEKIFAGEQALQAVWLQTITSLVEKAGLQMMSNPDRTAGMGGRHGFHTEYLSPLLEEMTEVYRSETGSW